MSKNKTIVFLCSFIYMMMELVASRIISPYFGSSNLVWTCVIGVIIISSCLGNYIGGLKADKENSNQEIVKIMTFAGAYTALIPVMSNYIFNVEALGAYCGYIGFVILILFILFAPPIFCISQITPICAKNELSVENKQGKSLGSIYSISSLGSVIGTFVGGLIVIPAMGSMNIVFVSSLFIILTMLLVDDTWRRKLTCLGITGVLLLSSFVYTNFFLISL